MIKKYKKQKQQETIVWCRNDIKFYTDLKKQMQEMMKHSSKFKEIYLEIIEGCNKEIRKARNELKSLL